MDKSRRKFIRNMAGIGTGIAAAGIIPGFMSSCSAPGKLFFSISIAQWSLHKSMSRWTPDGYTEGLDPLDFPMIARKQFGIDAVEYVNTFYFEKINDRSYLAELNNRCKAEGVKSVLIMVDSEGNLGASGCREKDERSKQPLSMGGSCQLPGLPFHQGQCPEFRQLG